MREVGRLARGWSYERGQEAVVARGWSYERGREAVVARGWSYLMRSIERSGGGRSKGVVLSYEIERGGGSRSKGVVLLERFH